MEEAKPKSYKAALIWSISGFLIFGGLAAFILSLSDKTVSFGTPIQSVEFESGDVFHLYQAEVSHELRLEFRTPKFSFSGNGSSGSSNGHLSYRLERSGDRMKAATIGGSRRSIGSVTNLIIVGRMESSMENPIIPEVISTSSYDSSDPPTLIEVSWDGFGDFDDIDKTSRTEQDGYWIEIEDGHGGWLPSIGPIVFQQDDGRSVSLRQSFPRLQKELKLRINTQSGETKVISIPNPAYIALSSSAWTADSKPWNKSYSELDLKITGFRKPKIDPAGRVLVPMPKLLVIPHDTSLPENSFWPQSPLMSDETGNTGQLLQFPGVKFVRFEGVVTRNFDRYPWKIADTIPILEYRVNDKGEPVFTWLPKASDYYLDTVTQNGGEISFRGKTPSSHKSPEIKWLIDFKKGKTLSEQVLRRGGSSSSGGMKFTEFEIDFSGKLPAGSEGVLAFPNLPESFPYEFTIPIEEIPSLKATP